MRSIGLSEILVLGATLALPLLAVLVFLAGARRRARRAGLGLRSYLTATPETDAEKAEAIELLLRGVMVCTVGLLFRPLILFGLLPLYVGGRKVLRAWFGLGVEKF
jgi:hypothetical protein